MIKNKFLKYFTVFVVSVLAILYIAFLTIPYFIKTDFIKPIVQDLVKQNSKLNLNYDELKFYTTPMLSAGAELKGINVTFDDNSSLFKADRIKAGLALPSILTLTIKTSRIYVDNPKINFEINENSEYKIVKLVEKIINENIKKPKENNVVSEFGISCKSRKKMFCRVHCSILQIIIFGIIRFFHSYIISNNITVNSGNIHSLLQNIVVNSKTCNFFHANLQCVYISNYSI